MYARDFNQMVQIVERVCGICSCLHALCYCEGLEKMMGIEVPRRAKYLRTIWGELHRIHSHLLWLGLFADAFGFESLFMQFWRVRERIMDIMEATCGNRVVVSVNVVGGVRRDLSPEQCLWIEDQLRICEKETKQLQSTLLSDYTVKKRTVGVGVLTKDQAYQLGAAGPTLRGSGWAQDVRQTGYAAFDELGFEPVVEYDGDCYARAAVRFRETLQAMDIVRLAIARMPAGETATNIEGALDDDTPKPVSLQTGDIMQAYRRDKHHRITAAPPPNLELPAGHLAVKVKGKPEGEVVHRVEQPGAKSYIISRATVPRIWSGSVSARRHSPTSRRFWPCCRMRAGGRAGHRPVHRPLRQLHRTVKKEHVSMFNMTKNVVANLLQKSSTRLYPSRCGVISRAFAAGSTSTSTIASSAGPA